MTLLGVDSHKSTHTATAVDPVSNQQAGSLRIETGGQSHLYCNVGKTAVASAVAPRRAGDPQAWKVHGAQGEVARRLGKTPPWGSQRLALLELTPELHEQVEGAS